MDYIKKLIVEKFLLSWVKGALDKIPGNGYKTLLGVLLLVLGVIIQALPQYAPFVQPLIDFMNYLPIDPITDMGIVTLITGLVHKVLKLLKLIY